MTIELNKIDECLTSWMNIPGIFQHGSTATTFGSFNQSYHEYLRAMEGIGVYNNLTKIRAHFKSRFGKKHDWYFKSWVPNYGWIDPENQDWMVIVSSRGTSFEVNKNFSPAQTIAAFETFRKIVE